MSDDYTLDEARAWLADCVNDGFPGARVIRERLMELCGEVDRLSVVEVALRDMLATAEADHPIWQSSIAAARADAERLAEALQREAEQSADGGIPESWAALAQHDERTKP